MPYIKPNERKAFDEAIARLSNITTPGELNYVITKLCHQFLSHKQVRYTDLNEVVGVLTCAQLELYRRRVVPYEDEKIKEHGDV